MAKKDDEKAKKELEMFEEAEKMADQKDLDFLEDYDGYKGTVIKERGYDTYTRFKGYERDTDTTEIAKANMLKIVDSPWKAKIDDLLFKKSLSDRAVALWLEKNAPVDAHYNWQQIRYYRQAREKDAKYALEKVPEFQEYKMAVREEINNSILAIRNIDIIGKLTEIIGDTSERLQQASDKVKITSTRDYNDTQRLMLETIRLYGELMLENERYIDLRERRENPTAKQTTNNTININLRESLADILRSATQEGDYSAIDAMRDIIDIPETQRESVEEE